MNRTIVGANAILAGAAVLCLLATPIAAAGGPSGPQATASVVTTKQFKKLKRKLARLQQQLNALARQPGPPGQQGIQGQQGSQGPAGTAPACQGNGSGDTMVPAGAVCIDKYEVSVWSTPTGGTQYGANSDNYPCNDDGHDCTNIYARSVAGVTPSRAITYFQAQQALANVGKRLPSNAEWQQAVAGTPDPGGDDDATDCNSSPDPGEPVNTGSRSNCVSRFGAMDMVGNLDEWTADWVPRSTLCINWDSTGTFASDDLMCLAGADASDDTFDGPGSLIRGGTFSSVTGAGPFAVNGQLRPSAAIGNVGFRGAR